METINVHFRKWPDGDIIALWSDDNEPMINMISSYQHMGQHSEAHSSLLICLDKASKQEYTPLLNELKSIGYHVNVVG